MRVLHPDRNPSRFFEQLVLASKRALLLDYDGTLAPFRTDRDRATPYPEVMTILEDIIGSGHTRVVIVSGRALDDLIPLLGWESLPEIWGCHGGERLLANGTRKTVSLENRTTALLEGAVDYLTRLGWGDRLEHKPFSVALHWRGIDPAERKRMRHRFSQYTAKTEVPAVVSLKEFDGGLELRPMGVNKGDAVRTILSEMPDGAAVAYLGDDQTDEDSFAILRQWDPSKIGVLVREAFRETKADLWIRPPSELLDFLKAWRAVTSLYGKER
jgi:trehalose-phosphatase